jgi:hypothetical protein
MGGLDVGLDDLVVAILAGLRLVLVGDEVSLEPFDSEPEVVSAADAFQVVGDPDTLISSLITLRGFAPVGGGGALALTRAVSFGDVGKAWGLFTTGVVSASGSLLTGTKLIFAFKVVCKIGLEMSRLLRRPLSGLGGASKLLTDEVGDKLPDSFDPFFNFAFILARLDMPFDEDESVVSGEDTLSSSLV